MCYGTNSTRILKVNGQHAPASQVGGDWVQWSCHEIQNVTSILLVVHQGHKRRGVYYNILILVRDIVFISSNGFISSLTVDGMHNPLAVV